MSNSRLCTAFFVLALGNVLLCAAGCGASEGGQEGTMNRNSQLPTQRQPSSPSSPLTESATVRFVVEPTKPPSPLSKGSFVDEQYAWVNDTGELKRTTDGGATWQLMRPTPQDETTFGRVRDTYARPYFVTPIRGWLKAGSGTWQTEDGGLTWHRIFAESSTPQFADDRHGWVNVFINESGEQSYITKDGGQTWQPCGVARDVNHQLSGRAYFLTPQLGWAITSRTVDSQTIYGVARTADGGCQWQQLWTSNESPDERYSSLYFLNEREGWLAGEFNLYRTTDGGRTWQEMRLPANAAQVTDVYFADSKEGWIIAALEGEDTESVFRTSDGGRSWRQLTKGEITSGEIPMKWKAGRLLQMLYASHAN